MDYFNKKRWTFWGVVLLVIMNVTSLATVWFQQHQRPLNHELFNELAMAAPDTLKAERLAEEIGVQQRELEKSTFLHFLALKRLCTPEQQKKLDLLFDELLRMMDPQRQPPPPDGRERPPRDG